MRSHQVGTLVILFLFSVTGAPVQEDVQDVQTTEGAWDYRTSEQCPMNPSLVGYTSLDNLQAEMNRHASNVLRVLVQEQDNGGEDSLDLPSELLYVLCPSASFDLAADAEPLVIPPDLLLLHPIVQCGNSTGSTNSSQYTSGSCVIRSGHTQIMIGDSTTRDVSAASTSINNTFVNGSAVPSDNDSMLSSSIRTTAVPPFIPKERSITFRGITFADSQEISVAILMSPARSGAASRRLVQQHLPVEATFIDCHWTGNKGQAAILMAAVQLFDAGDVGDSTHINNFSSNMDDIVVHQNILEDSFGNRLRKRRLRQPQDRRLASAISTSTGPLFQCIECTFQDGGEYLSESTLHSRFVLVDSFIQNARIILSSTLISKISGASLLINAVHGASLHLENVQIQESSTSMALIQTQYRSILHAEGLVLKNNNARVSMLVAEDSQAFITHSQFQQDSALGVPISILALSSSQVTVQQSCLPTLQSPSTTSGTTAPQTAVTETTPVIVVDDSSSISHDEKTILVPTASTSSAGSETTTTSATSSMAMLMGESPPSFSCKGPIWVLDGPGDCLDQGHCSGRCQSMASSDHCPLSEGDNQWTSSVLQSSSASTIKKPMAATMHSILIANMVVGASILILGQYR